MSSKRKFAYHSDHGLWNEVEFAQLKSYLSSNSKVKAKKYIATNENHILKPLEGGSFRPLTSTGSEIHAINKSRQNANSDIKIRSHQRLVTPPEGGSFRQLTSCIQM